MDQKELFALFEELIVEQRKRMLKLASQYVEGITEEDLLQPFDYPVLESHPLFRYEEGVLEGFLTAQMAIQSKL